jgi:hypothetical protein
MNGLGRCFALDHRDGDHLLRAVVPPTRPKRQTWRLDARLDQGSYPHCVGYSWKHRVMAAPYRSGKGDPIMFYQGAQKHDEWAGENYNGTSVRGGAKYLQAQGYIVAYRWAFSAEEALNAVGSEGPVVLGTDWKSGMSDPTQHGQHFVMRFDGRNVGGHAYLMLGYDDYKGMALIHNSWGPSWGLNGRAWLPYEDLEEAIRQAGEACCPTER